MVRPIWAGPAAGCCFAEAAVPCDAGCCACCPAAARGLAAALDLQLRRTAAAARRAAAYGGPVVSLVWPAGAGCSYNMVAGVGGVFGTLTYPHLTLAYTGEFGQEG